MSILTLPRVVKRRTTPYVAIARETAIPFGRAIDKSMPKVGKWLADEGIAHGPAIFRYTRIKMPELSMEFGFLLPRKHAGAGEIVAGMLPAGAYATLTHWGHYKHLMEATATLIGWARLKGIRWESEEQPDGERFAARFELYPNGPADEPDPAKWETQIFIKIRE